MIRSSRALVAIILGIAFAQVVPIANAQDTDPRLRKVLADWEKRQNAIDRIRYEVSGQQVIPKGSLRDSYGEPLKSPAPADDITSDVKWLVLLDFATGRHRREVSEQSYHSTTNRFRSRVSVDVCNGRVSKWAAPREKNTNEWYTPPANQPDLIIASGNLRGIPFESEYMPLFFAHGIIRTIVDEVTPGKLRRKTDPDYLVFHGQGVHGGRPCSVVRTQALQLSTTSYGEFWVDPAKDSAVVRYVIYSGNKVFNDIDIKYQQTPRGWLPEQWTFTHYSGTAPTNLYRMRVQSWSADPPVSDADFDLPMNPGVVVEERVYEEAKNPLVNPNSAVRIYRLGGSGGETELPDSFNRPRLEKPRSRYWYWLAGAIGIVVMAALMVWVARKRRIAAAR